jgi:hypothetical protein
VPLPPLTARGLLPPFVGLPTDRGDRSPYLTTMADVFNVLGGTAHRRALLQGFLDYRSAVRAAGVTQALQWIAGSFVEDRPGAEPNDIDVVTISHLDPALVAAIKNADLDDPDVTRATFNCDAYWIDLEWSRVAVVRATSYWLGLLSHRRVTFAWKGIAEVLLNDPNDPADAAIVALLRPTP